MSQKRSYDKAGSSAKAIIFISLYKVVIYIGNQKCTWLNERFCTCPNAYLEEAKKLARPMDYDYLDLLENRFTYLRKYTPALLKSLEFRSTKAAEPLLRALKNE